MNTTKWCENPFEHLDDLKEELRDKYVLLANKIME